MAVLTFFDEARRGRVLSELIWPLPRSGDHVWNAFVVRDSRQTWTSVRDSHHSIDCVLLLNHPNDY